MKKLSLLGATGSIGVNVLNIVRKFPSRFTIVGLAAGRNVELLSQQVEEFKPEIVSVIDEEHGERLASMLPSSWDGNLVSGVEGNTRVAAHPDATMTITAVVGAAGLLPTLAAIKAGKNIGLAENYNPRSQCCKQRPPCYSERLLNSQT